MPDRLFLLELNYITKSKSESVELVLTQIKPIFFHPKTSWFNQKYHKKKEFFDVLYLPNFLKFRTEISTLIRSLIINTNLIIFGSLR